jgi:hypothetical protein
MALRINVEIVATEDLRNLRTDDTILECEAPEQFALCTGQNLARWILHNRLEDLAREEHTRGLDDRRQQREQDGRNQGEFNGQLSPGDCVGTGAISRDRAGRPARLTTH